MVTWYCLVMFLEKLTFLPKPLGKAQVTRRQKNERFCKRIVYLLPKCVRKAIGLLMKVVFFWTKRCVSETKLEIKR